MGKFTFKGTIGGVAFDIAIRTVGSNMFEVSVEADGLDLTGSANPVSIEFRVGDDFGTIKTRLRGKLKL